MVLGIDSALIFLGVSAIMIKNGFTWKVRSYFSRHSFLYLGVIAVVLVSVEPLKT